MHWTGVYVSQHALGRGCTPPRQTPPKQTPPWADTPKQIHTPFSLGRHPPQADTHPLPGQTSLGRHPLGRHSPFPETATAADSMHPTGMHSCDNTNF